MNNPECEVITARRRDGNKAIVGFAFMDRPRPWRREDPPHRTFANGVDQALANRVFDRIHAGEQAIKEQRYRTHSGSLLCSASESQRLCGRCAHSCNRHYAPEIRRWQSSAALHPGTGRTRRRGNLFGGAGRCAAPHTHTAVGKTSCVVTAEGIPVYEKMGYEAYEDDVTIEPGIWVSPASVLRALGFV